VTMWVWSDPIGRLAHTGCTKQPGIGFRMAGGK
jgi:hypothetical protein